MAAPAFAVTTVYTSSAAFLANVAPGAYTNTFAGAATPSAASSYSFSQGAFSYTIAGNGQQPATWINGSVIGNNYPNNVLTINFTSGNITAVGGELFIMNDVGGFQSALVTVTLNDGTVQAYTPTNAANSYRGFISTAPITSMTFSAPVGTLRFNAIDNFTVGTAAPIPEPSVWLLLGLGLSAVLLAKRNLRHR